MKLKSKSLIALLAVGASACVLMAQAQSSAPRHRPPPPPPGEDFDGPPPPPPIVATLDVNHDGVIDAQEIANASKALLELDENGDGKLTFDELCPPPPPEEEGAPRPHRPPPGPRGEK